MTLPVVLPETVTDEVSVRITVDPPHLEDLLECLAELNLPIDPAIHHGPLTTVQFRIAGEEANKVRKALRLSGFTRIAIHSA